MVKQIELDMIFCQMEISVSLYHVCVHVFRLRVYSVDWNIHTLHMFSCLCGHALEHLAQADHCVIFEDPVHWLGIFQS